MTREEILAMEPGRELDIKIYKNVIYPETPNNILNDDLKDPDFTLPNYSTDISAAWEVVRKAGYHIVVEGHFHTGWKVTLGETVSVSAWDLPEAICKAALLAVTDAQGRQAIDTTEIPNEVEAEP